MQKTKNNDQMAKYEQNPIINSQNMSISLKLGGIETKSVSCCHTTKCVQCGKNAKQVGNVNK